MKNRFIFVAFIFSLFSSFVFFGTAFAKTGSVSKESIRDLKKLTKSLESQVNLLQKQINLKNPSVTGDDKLQNGDRTLLEMYAHGPAVVTSPAFSVRRAADDKYEDDSPLMSQLSPVKEDLVLLHLREKITNYADKYGIDLPHRPIIALSGALEAQINNKSNYDKSERTDINLSRAELDVISEVGPWVTSGVIITYDDDRLEDGTARVSNSKLKIDRAYMTLGQLKKCPFYLTMGQVFAPFGKYSSHMVTTPPTRALGLFKDRMIVLGYSKGPFNMQLYGFPGEIDSANNGLFKNLLGHTGASIAHNFIAKNFELDIEASAMGNIAETEDMQSKIFDKKSDKKMQSRVWGMSGRAKVKYGQFSILSEYVGASRSFDERDISFNDRGAKPQALNVEAALDFKLLGKPSDVVAGYAQTWDALSLDLPKRAYFVGCDMAIFKDTLFSLEYRHDVNYNWNDRATNVESIPGRHKNIITAKMAVYF